MHCALNRAAVHFCWVTAYLYDEFIFTGVTTMTHCLLSACFAEQHEQSGMHFALNRAAVHLSWVTTHLYEELISIGVTVETHYLL